MKTLRNISHWHIFCFRMKVWPGQRGKSSNWTNFRLSLFLCCMLWLLLSLSHLGRIRLVSIETNWPLIWSITLMRLLLHKLSPNFETFQPYQNEIHLFLLHARSGTHLIFVITMTTSGCHTCYLSFFLHWQNFWRIRFTPKNANFSR